MRLSQAIPSYPVPVQLQVARSLTVAPSTQTPPLKQLVSSQVGIPKISQYLPFVVGQMHTSPSKQKPPFWHPTSPHVAKTDWSRD
jgi:hypothetical protein